MITSNINEFTVYLDSQEDKNIDTSLLRLLTTYHYLSNLLISLAPDYSPSFSYSYEVSIEEDHGDGLFYGYYFGMTGSYFYNKDYHYGLDGDFYLRGDSCWACRGVNGSGAIAGSDEYT